MAIELSAPTKFVSYEAHELAAIGTDFVASIAQHHRRLGRIGTEAWTEFVLDWWGATAPDDILVDGRVQRLLVGRSQYGVKFRTPARYGEFMLDLVHSTYPTYEVPYLSIAYWDRALSKPLRIRLALESEWGDEMDGALSLAKILEDAAKVASVRADMNVMVFASSPKNPRERICEYLGRLRTWTASSTPWLWVDVPWEFPARDASCGLLP